MSGDTEKHRRLWKMELEGSTTGRPREVMETSSSLSMLPGEHARNKRTRAR